MSIVKLSELIIVVKFSVCCLFKCFLVIGWWWVCVILLFILLFIIWFIIVVVVDNRLILSKLVNWINNFCFILGVSVKLIYVVKISIVIILNLLMVR